jgi:TPR repeat protein
MVLVANMLSCHAQATGAKRKKSAKETALSQACDDGDGAACAELATLLLSRDDVSEKHARRAISLLERGCELKAATACAGLAKELAAGIWLEKDPVRMVQLAQMGCNLGEVEACIQLAVAHLNGVGVEQSFQKALPLLKHACEEEDPEGCFQLGVMVLEGKGSPADPVRALGILDTGCELASGSACHRLGELYASGDAPTDTGKQSGAPDFRKAASYFIAGCELDHAAACVFLGKMRRAGQGMGMDEDVAEELFSKACHLGDVWGCVESNSYPSDGAVLESMRRQCEDGLDAQACYCVGSAWLKGDDDTQFVKGAALLQEACDSSVAGACHRLGVALNSGERLPKDLTRAQGLFKKACKGGIKKACGR